MKVASINEWKNRHRRSGEEGVSPACPVCPPGFPLIPSHPNGLVERVILRWLGKRPFRCRGCGRRFWVTPPNHKPRPEGSNGPASFDPAPAETFAQVIDELRRAERASRQPPVRLSAIGGKIGVDGSHSPATPHQGLTDRMDKA